MNDGVPELIELELRKLRPAKPPEGLMARLVAAQPAPVSADASHSEVAPVHAWWRLLLRLAPAAAAAAAICALLVWRLTVLPGLAVTPGTKPVVKADNVEIDQHLIAAFDTVARMPGGEPVRFHCREWTDQIVLRDSARGVVVEQLTPRLEIVPVSVEIY